ncbi:unnamed protein product, partial [Trichobilharzia szidati]
QMGAKMVRDKRRQTTATQKKASGVLKEGLIGESFKPKCQNLYLNSPNRVLMVVNALDASSRGTC